MTLPEALTHDPAEPAVPKVQLVGSVAGVQACLLVTDHPRMIVGSAPDCDLVIMDPLVPRRAFVLEHEKEHATVHHECASCWSLETHGGARVYVNGNLVRRARLAPGDRIALGCHKIAFDRHDGHERDNRSNTAINDLCQRLLTPDAPPTGFLHGLPSWRDWLRMRRAGLTGAAVALLLLCLVLLSPRTPRFESTHPPIEVVMLADRNQAAVPGITSLSQVARRSAATPAAEEAKLIEPEERAPPQSAAAPFTPRLPNVGLPPDAPAEQLVADAGPFLGSLTSGELSEPLAVPRAATTGLGTSAPRKRIALHGPPRPEAATLADVGLRADASVAPARTYSRYAASVLERSGPAAAPRLDDVRSGAADSLEYRPSPLTFEQYRGQRIPIARVPQSLTALTGGDGSPRIALDGNVSAAEAALSFKTGRFRTHGPGTPPEADPATYCYVSKSQDGGKDCLYVSFVCSDPNLGALVVKEPSGVPGLAWDDSVEVFLDLNGDRNDYHHIIVSARGNHYSCYCPDGDAGVNGRGTAWDSGMRVKTTIDPSGSRWVCELMIPFDRLPQVPAKGAEIPFNVCRNFRGQHSNNALQNWFAVYEGTQTNYHHPRLFGKLVWPQ